MSRTPAYKEMSEWLRTEAHRRGPGALMPTIRQACEEFGVSGVGTVQSAYAPLIEEGLVELLASPKRWAVVDAGQAPAPKIDIDPALDELESSLLLALQRVKDLRRDLAA
jgi:DNA-binding transcriptional MocR family regulator